MDYWKFVKKYAIGIEGGSCWCWVEQDGSWMNVGFAEKTIEEALDKLYEFLKENTGLCVDI